MRLIETRWSTAADAASLAELHRAAWRNAYAGIIPGLTLERMIARRGADWWRGMHGAGGRALVVEFDETVAGYATLGRGRSRDRGHRCGEIYELYVRPEYQGCGLGRSLFRDARARLRRRGLDGLLVWALAENEVACRFYLAMAGTECARGQDRFCGKPLEKVGFAWS